MKRVLLSYVCRPFVGHSIEALRYTRGLFEANPGIEVHLALSDRSVPEIVEGCPWITAVHPIHLADLEGPAGGRAALGGLSTEWDYIIDDATIVAETDGIDPVLLDPETVALRRYYELTAGLLTARAGRGTLSPSLRLPAGLAYRPGTKVSLTVPSASRAAARRYAHTGPKVGVMLGGSFGYPWYPEVSSWIMILLALRRAFPAIRFYLTGSRQSGRGQTRTAGYTDADIANVLRSGPDIVDCYDIGFWNQIALIEGCDLLVSPRTGFASVALCVGTPWLTIAGGDWPEYFFNGVPFYPVLPDDPDYPYRAQRYPEDTTEKITGMRPERLDRKIPEIVEAARLLMNPDFTYEAAVRCYRESIGRANVDRRHLPLPTDPSLASF